MGLCGGLHSQVVRVQAWNLRGRWLAIDDPLHDAHPSLIESQSNITHNSLLFLKLDNKASHHERIVWTFASLARFPKAHAT